MLKSFKFVRANSDELVDELHQTQLNMNFTFVRFMGSFGLPTGAANHTSKVSKKFQKLIQNEIEKRSKETNQENSDASLDYLSLLLAKKLPGQANDFIWSHIAHLILSCHALFVSNLGWSFFHIRKLQNNEEDINLLNDSFIEACILETTRRYTPVMISKTIHDQVIFKNECKVQQGSTLFLCPASIQLDEKVFIKISILKPHFRLEF